MSNPEMLFSHAELALASYATLANGPTDTEAQRRELVRQGFGGNLADASSIQATEFATRFPTIVTQFNDTPAEDGMGTSFSATVFKDASTPGKLTLAIRGTSEFVGDFVPTDADIAVHGAAYDQIAAMVSWWLRATTPTTQQVVQYRVKAYTSGSGVAPPADVLDLYNTVVATDTGPVITRYVLEAAPSVSGSGLLVDELAADPDLKIDVTGHSLGGHLALAFNKLFASVTGQVAVFNAPGFIDSTTNQAFFSRLGGVVPTAANSGSVLNIKADETGAGEVPWLGIAGRHSRPGVAIDIPIENQWLSDEPVKFDAFNHRERYRSRFLFSHDHSLT